MFNSINFQDHFENSHNSETISRIIEDKPLKSNEILQFIESSTIKDLLYLASYLRNKQKSDRITYSRKVFINLINLCKDSCSYCTYKKEPLSTDAVMLTPSQVLSIAEAGKKLKCTEALIVTGERPELKYQEAKKWLKDFGFTSLTELIVNLSEMILKKTGILPHTNAGSLTKKEMSLLQSTNVSLGMMLENSSEKLLEKGKAHEHAPSKNPKVRLKSITSAGELKFPLTTGILVGIGESFIDVINSLLLIKDINLKYGHIQEVIIQNFAPKSGTVMEYYESPSYDYFLKCIIVARILLKNINIQVPPNLSPKIYSNYIEAGINDWGGISPLTPDYVNPEYPWPSINDIKNTTFEKGFQLRGRLPIYPEYIIDNNLNHQFINKNLKCYIEPLIDKYGLVKEEYINNES